MKNTPRLQGLCSAVKGASSLNAGQPSVPCATPAAFPCLAALSPDTFDVATHWASVQEQRLMLEAVAVETGTTCHCCAPLLHTGP